MADASAAAADKVLLASVVQYLSRTAASASDASAEALQMAVDALVANMELSKDDFAASSCAPSLDLAFESARSASSSVADNPLFAKYIENLEKRGYFGDLAHSSADWERKYKAAIERFQSRMASNSADTPADKSATPPPAPGTSADDEKAAGNAHLQAGRFQEAVDAYTRALAISSSGPNSHIYLCNRAAAHLKLQQHSSAVEDAQAALALQPSYVKAFNRLGSAYFYQKLYPQALAAYEGALDVEPSNATAVSGVAATKAAQDAAASSSNGGSGSGPASSAAATLPQQGAPGGNPLGGMDPAMLSQMASMMGGGGGGGGGGMPDLGSMLSNPAMQSMMSSPQFQSMAQNLMSNPAAMQQMAGMAQNMFGGGGGGGGGGGMDPAMLSQMASMMGGGGSPQPPSEQQ